MDWQDFSIIGPFEQLIADFEGAFRRLLPSYLFSFPESSHSSNSVFFDNNSTNTIVHYPPSSNLSERRGTRPSKNNNRSFPPFSTKETINTGNHESTTDHQSSSAANGFTNAVIPLFEDENIVRTTYISLPIDGTRSSDNGTNSSNQILILSITYVNIPLYHRIAKYTTEDSKGLIFRRYPHLVSVASINHYNPDILHKLPLWYGEDHYLMIRTSQIVSSNDLIQNLSSLHPNLLLPYMFDPSLCKKVLSAATIALEHLELVFLQQAYLSADYTGKLQVQQQESPSSSLSSSTFIKKHIEYIRSLSIFVQLYEPSKNSFLGHATHRYRAPSSGSDAVVLQQTRSTTTNNNNSLPSSVRFIQTVYRTDEIVSRAWLTPSYLAYNGCGTLSSAPVHVRNYSALLYNFVARLIDNRTLLSLQREQNILPDKTQLSVENLQQLKKKYKIQCNVNYKWRIGITTNNNFLPSSSNDNRINNQNYRGQQISTAPVQTIDIQSIWCDKSPPKLSTSRNDSIYPTQVFPESPSQVTVAELNESSLFTLRIQWQDNSWITRTNLFYSIHNLHFRTQSMMVPQTTNPVLLPSSTKINPTVAELFLSSDDHHLSKDTDSDTTEKVTLWTPKRIMDSFYPSGFLLSTLQNNSPFCTLASPLVILYEAFETSKVLVSLDIDSDYLLSSSKPTPITTNSPIHPQIIAELQTRNMSNLTSPGFGLPLMMNTVPSHLPIDERKRATDSIPPSFDRTIKIRPTKELSGYSLGSECLLTLPIRSIPLLYVAETLKDNNPASPKPLWQGTSSVEREDIALSSSTSSSLYVSSSESTGDARSTNREHLRKRDRLWNVIHQIRRSAVDRFDNTVKLPFRNRLNEIHQARNDVQTMISNAFESAKLVFGGAKMVQDKVNDLSQYLMEEDIIQILNEVSNAEESIRNRDTVPSFSSSFRSESAIGPSASSSSVLTTFTFATINLIQRILVDPINQQQEFHIHRFEALTIPENSDISAIPAKDIGIPSYFGLGRVSPSLVLWAQDPTIQYTSNTVSSSSPNYININESIARYHILQDIIVNVICSCWSVFIRSLRNEWDEVYNDYILIVQENRQPSIDNTVNDTQTGKPTETDRPVLSLSDINFDQCIVQQKLELLKLHITAVTQCVQDTTSIDKYRLRTVSSHAKIVYPYSKHYLDLDSILESLPVPIKNISLQIQYPTVIAPNRYYPRLPVPAFQDQALFLLQPLFVAAGETDPPLISLVSSFAEIDSSSTYSVQLIPLIIPPLDDIVPTTLDIVLEDQQQLLQTGIGFGKYVSLRTIHNTDSLLSSTNRLSLDILAQDMRIFRLYNPLAGLIDFIRWYFPNSWSTTEIVNDSSNNSDTTVNDLFALLASVQVYPSPENAEESTVVEDNVSFTKIVRSLLYSMNGSFASLSSNDSIEPLRVRWMMDPTTKEFKLYGNTDSTVIQHKILCTIWDSLDNLIHSVKDSLSFSSTIAVSPPLSPFLYKNRASFRFAETVENIFDYFEGLPVSELMGQLFSGMLSKTSESLLSIMNNTSYSLGYPLDSSLSQSTALPTVPQLPILTPAYHQLQTMMKMINHTIESFALSSMNHRTLFTESSDSSLSHGSNDNHDNVSAAVYRTPTKENNPYRFEQSSAQQTTENTVSPREIYQAYKESRQSFMETLSKLMQEFSASVADFETLNYRQQWLSNYLTEHTTLLNSIDMNEIVHQLSHSSLSSSLPLPSLSSLSSSSVRNISFAEGISRFYLRRIVSPLVYSLTHPSHTIHHNLQVNYPQNDIVITDNVLVKLYHQIDGIPCVLPGGLSSTITAGNASTMPADNGVGNSDHEERVPSYIFLNGGGANGSGNYSGITEYSCCVPTLFFDNTSTTVEDKVSSSRNTIVTRIQRQLIVNLLYQQSIIKGIPSPLPLTDIFASVILPADEITNLFTSTLPRFKLPTIVHRPTGTGKGPDTHDNTMDISTEGNMKGSSLMEHRMYVHINYDSVRIALRMDEDDG